MPDSISSTLWQWICWYPIEHLAETMGSQFLPYYLSNCLTLNWHSNWGLHAELILLENAEGSYLS